eukprot:gene4595-biopygen12691
MLDREDTSSERAWGQLERGCRSGGDEPTHVDQQHQPNLLRVVFRQQCRHLPLEGRIAVTPYRCLGPIHQKYKLLGGPLVPAESDVMRFWVARRTFYGSDLD